MKECIFMGTFDPFHNGHLMLIEKLSKEYDVVYVFIAKNYLKFEKRMFTPEIMRQAISKTISENGIKNVVCVDESQFLPCVCLSKKLKCNNFVRGVRPEDALFEFALRKVNSIFGLKTYYCPSGSDCSSRKIKEDFKNNKDISNLVPKEVFKLFQEKQKKHVQISEMQKNLDSDSNNNEVKTGFCGERKI